MRAMVVRCATSEVKDMSLRQALGEHLWAYEIPEDDLVGDVLVPSMKEAEEVRIAAGYFSSGCLAQIAPGLAEYLRRERAPLRLLMSPFVSGEDRDAIRRAVRSPDEVLNSAAAELLRNGKNSEEALVRHAVDCLAYLVASNRLELRVVLMQEGQYHKKQWFFREGHDWLVVHGSGNATQRGMLVNGEQMSLDATWTAERTALSRIQKYLAGWDAKWSGQSTTAVVLHPHEALEALREMAPRDRPTHEEFLSAWRQDAHSGALGVRPSAPATRGLRIPRGLRWNEGSYQHQSRAVEAFERNSCRGILSIATGGGKTKTALVCAARYQERADAPCLVVILVPTLPLSRQWHAEVAEFGVAATVLSQASVSARARLLAELRMTFASGEKCTEVVIVTNSLLARSEDVRGFIENCAKGTRVFLIADEVHNLGASGYISNPLQRPEARLGLSATPIRQYDASGTARLFEYFSGQVFEFSLKDAIASGCLVPYDYHPHEVVLDVDEYEEFVRLSVRIRQLGFSGSMESEDEFGDSELERCLRDRRAIIENARGKIAVLRRVLRSYEGRGLERSLFYASAKRSRVNTEPQILAVNSLLREQRISFHQITSEETSSGEAASYLQRFADGNLTAVTAMKVLDEGLDVPAARTAFLIGSSSVEREWVQRRGRVLRNAPGKRYATLHDFIVVPPNYDQTEAKSLLRLELRRASQFAELAQNEWLDCGPRKILLDRLEQQL
jgi:superfamily II DNA or RNA helicase